MKAFRPLSDLDGGRLVFNSKKALNPHHPVTVPCGNCIGCRIDRSREWAIRCSHEASMSSTSCFLTLTYSDEYLPHDYSVHVRTWQLFMKRLRKSLRSNKIRFFACGEYGDETLRPHYHALIFNYSPTDKIFYKKTNSDDNLYTSPSLSKIWSYGQVYIGDVTYKSSAYVARYIMKKINGDNAVNHYTRFHPKGHIVTVEPEFCVQSRRPGIGYSWFQKYKTDAFPSDFLVVDGRPHPVPKFYLKLLKQEEAVADETKPYFKALNAVPSAKVVRARIINSLSRATDNTRERLAVREEVKKQKLKTLKRSL